MKRLFVTLLLAPFVVFAQSAPISTRSNNSTVTGTQTANAFTCSNTTTALFTSSAAATAGNSDIGFTFTQANALSTDNDTDTCFRFKNASTSLYDFKCGGRLDMHGATNATQPGFKIDTPSGGSLQLRLGGGSGDLAQFIPNSTISQIQIGNSANTSEVIRIGREADGSNPELNVFDTNVFMNVPAKFDQTDSSGTAGAVTINKPAGKAAVAAGASSVVVTNSYVATTNIVLPVLQASDATCTSVKSVVPASGSFTITLNANCTADTKVAFVVH